MFRLIGICCVLVALLATQVLAAPRGIIGKDDREMVPDKYRALARGIGIIHDQRRGHVCTAFCVGGDVIATNAHCIPYFRNKGRKQIRKINDFLFYLMANGAVSDRTYLRDNPVGDKFVPWMSVLYGRALDRSARRRRSAGAWLREQRHDWALAKLAKPLCSGHVIAFAGASFIRKLRRPPRAKIFTIGFHGDKSDGYSRYAPCRIRKVTGRGKRLTVDHTCDTVSGASGSPIFAPTRAGPRVIALVVGHVRGRRWRRYPNGRQVTVARWHTNVGVLPLEFLDKLDRFRGAHFVPFDLSIRQLQASLIASGYLRGKADNIFGPATRAAIVRVEKKLGLVPLGIPTLSVISHLGEQ